MTSIGFAGGTARLSASATPQEHHDEDYSKNKTYQQGMRDARDDQAHNRDHSKKRHFKNENDQRAYESGYQAGHQGESHDRDSHDSHDHDQNKNGY
jgi:ribosome modulation factor